MSNHIQINNEIFQYKLYLQEDSTLREFFIGKDNSNLNLTYFKNEKYQSLLHLAVLKKDHDTILDCLEYLNLNPNEEDMDGNSPIDLISKEDEAITKIFEAYTY